MTDQEILVTHIGEMIHVHNYEGQRVHGQLMTPSGVTGKSESCRNSIG